MSRGEQSSGEGLPDRLWQQCLEILPHPAFVKDREGRYLACNLAFANHLGIPPSRILGLTVFDLAPEDLARVYRKADEDLLRDGGVQVYDAKVRYADGTFHDIRFRKVRLEGPDGSAVGIAGFMEDVTERRRLEVELSERHAEMAGALMASGELVFLVDADLRFQPLPYPHPEERGDYAARPVDFLGRTISETFPEPYASRFSTIVSRVLTDGRVGDFTYEMEIGGERRFFEGRAVRLLVDSARGPRCVILCRDVTRRRNVEDGLRTHALVLSSMPLGYMLCRLEDAADPESLTIRALNGAAERIFGIPSARLVGNRSVDVFPTLKSTGAVARFAEVVRTGRGIEIPRFDYGDERMSVRTYAVKVEPIGDRRLIFLFEDITPRLEAEAREEEQRALHHELVRQGPDLVYRISPEGVFEQVHGPAEELIGYTPQELAGRTFASLLEPADIPRVMTVFLQALRGSPVPLQAAWARARDGRRVHFEFWAVPVRRGDRIVGVQGSARDITARRDAEEAIRKAGQSLRELQRLAGFHPWSRDLATGRITWSDGLYALTGLEPRESIEMAEFLAVVHPDDRERLRNAASELENGRIMPRIDFRLVLGGGEVRSVFSTAHIVFGPDGRPSRIEGVIQDVTEQVRSAAAARDAVASSEAVRLVERLGHDLNNPLSALSMRLELLQGMAADLPPEAGEHLAVAVEQATRLRDAVRMVLGEAEAARHRAPGTR